MSIPVFARFETELSVRPDDIDLYQHVHSTRYLDYVLAARFDQMERCYGMSMKAFAALGLGWFMKAASIQYRRPLGIGDRMIVRTWITNFIRMVCAWALRSTGRTIGSACATARATTRW